MTLTHDTPCGRGLKRVVAWTKNGSRFRPPCYVAWTRLHWTKSGLNPTDEMDFVHGRNISLGLLMTVHIVRCPAVCMVGCQAVRIVEFL